MIKLLREFQTQKLKSSAQSLNNSQIQQLPDMDGPIEEMSED